MRRPRRNHTAMFRAKVAVAALKGDKTMIELAEKFDVHAHQITQWKPVAGRRVGGLYDAGGEARGAGGPTMKDMQAKIGQQALEIVFRRACAIASTGIRLF